MKRFRFTPLIYALFLFLASCNENFYNYSGAVWGTTFNISYKSGQQLDDSIDAVLRSVDESLSMFNPGSTIARINAGSDMRADSLVTGVLDLSRRVWDVSGGSFDPTVGPLVELWGFGPGRRQGKPDSAAIALALSRTGLHKCNVADGQVCFSADSMRLDFSAIAKGYGVDRIASLLSRNGCNDFMVEIGGEINARGMNPDGRPWRIQIDAPSSAPDGSAMHDRLRIIELRDAALATSGNYRNFRLLPDGRRVGHTISPLSGLPVLSETLSVSVMAGECALADALATAAMAMPYADARTMIDSLDGVEALFVLSAPDGGTQVIATDGFPEAL
ncbi:MAG: FAD:protein FMN transferase [Muribaculaceae bacterium]|nr:FAD:protein FMN transferase [Muribaculaceae bacterium]